MHVKIILSVTLLLAVPSAFAGGGDWIKQSVYGMDCAPCAYAIERGLARMPGVKSVTVSLQRGVAEVILAEGAEADITALREIVRRNGFTPQAAEVRLTGRVTDGDVWALTVGTRRYALVPGDSVSSDELARLHGHTASLIGTVAADDADRIAVAYIESH